MANHVKKGKLFAISGQLVQERWETQGGEKRSKVTIRVNRLYPFLEPKADGAPQQVKATVSQQLNQEAQTDGLPF
jgi:single-stranded DNA-binding protein